MASRFWVGGTGTWNATDTTFWAASSGGAGGQSVPGSADTVTFDGLSGGGTVTVNTTVTVTSITMGAFTGTLDFSANNNNVTLSNGFSGTGSGTRTLNMGNGTWSVTGSVPWNMTTTTGLTFAANSSTLIITGSTAIERSFTTGGLTYNIVTFDGNSSGGNLSLSGSPTFATLNINAPNYVKFAAGTTITVTNAMNINGSADDPIGFTSATVSTAVTMSSANNGTFTWCAFRDMAFSGGGTFSATNSFDLGENSGITITGPVVGGSSGGRVIGG